MANTILLPNKENRILLKLSTFIVDKRNLFFLIFAVMAVFCFFSRNWVNVESDLIQFLPENTETKKALVIMDDEFVTYGTAEVLVSNLSKEQAAELAEKMRGLNGVAMVQFDETPSHYNNAAALYDVTFKYEENDEKYNEALKELKSNLSGYDSYVSTTLTSSIAGTIKEEMKTTVLFVAIVVLLVLSFTSSSWAEIPLLIIVFLVSYLLNVGTNFIFDKISFVSDSVTVVLQLALSVDYAIIMINRFREEHRIKNTRDACISASTRAVPEILASSLTTIGGLSGMLFMQFRIGKDLGLVLIKSILCSLMTVYLLMPGLIMVFSSLIDKTRHKYIVPKVSFIGKFAYKSRRVVTVSFIFILIASCFLSLTAPYVYGYSLLRTPKLNEQQTASIMIDQNFSTVNRLVLILPGKDYEKEKLLLTELSNTKEVEYTMGLPSIDAIGGYKLADKLTPRQFSELLDLDYEQAQLLYTAYAVNDEDYAKVLNGMSAYSVPLLDMIQFAYREVTEGYVTLEDDLFATLSEANDQITIARNQLEGKDHSRVLIYSTLPEEGEETFRYIDSLHDTAKKYYGEDADVYVAGPSTSEYDLYTSFSRDNRVMSIITVVIVLTVLLISFKSVGMPVLMILIIQGAIWINFSLSTLMGHPVFFMVYLIVSAIQMGANIDYAIVVSNRYTELRKTLEPREAIIEAMNRSFPTIITSGLMMAVSGFLIGALTSEPSISGIGMCLGRGTVISLILIMFVLPQLLVAGEKIIKKSSFHSSDMKEIQTAAPKHARSNMSESETGGNTI